MPPVGSCRRTPARPTPSRPAWRAASDQGQPRTWSSHARCATASLAGTVAVKASLTGMASGAGVSRACTTEPFGIALDNPGSVIGGSTGSALLRRAFPGFSMIADVDAARRGDEMRGLDTRTTPTCVMQHRGGIERTNEATPDLSMRHPTHSASIAGLIGAALPDPATRAVPLDSLLDPGVSHDDTLSRPITCVKIVFLNTCRYSGIAQSQENGHYVKFRRAA